MFYYNDPTWLWVLPGIILAMIASAMVNSAYRKYAKVHAQSGMTAAQVAQQMMRDAGADDVRVEAVQGRLTDHYDPRSKVLRLSQEVYGSTSISALGIAAHEAGHAIQHAQAYGALSLRTNMVPVTQFASHAAVPLFIGGLVLSWEPLVWLGVAFFAVAVVFSLITLPVEFNASSRAIYALESGGYLTREENEGAKKVLRAAALTYVASALTAILQLIRLLTLAGGRSSRD